MMPPRLLSERFHTLINIGMHYKVFEKYVMKRDLTTLLWTHYFIMQRNILVKSLNSGSIAYSNPIAVTHGLCDCGQIA